MGRDYAYHDETLEKELSFQNLSITWEADDSEDMTYDIIRFNGKITELNSFKLNAKFYKIIENNSAMCIILDLSDLTQINSTGLAILHSITYRFRERDRRVAIGGIHPKIRKILSLADIIPDVKVFDSHDTAKKSKPWQYHL